MFTWPERAEVDKAVRAWAKKISRQRPELIRLGYFGSYARDEWGVGSDLDLVAVVEKASEPFERRNIEWDLNLLPVPAELLVYTREEWRRLQEEGRRFARTLDQETVWVYPTGQT